MTENKEYKLEDYFLTLPLYEDVFIKEEMVFDIAKVLYYQGTIDSYCTDCQRDSTFSGLQESIPRTLSKENYNTRRNLGSIPETPKINTGTYEVKFKCARNRMHFQWFIFFIFNKINIIEGKPHASTFIKKIGQYPSYADLNISKVKKYSSVLSNNEMAELVKAIGLASHDVGIGAYVYLRRIFENLIEEAHQTAKKEDDWNEKAYEENRMKEKISMLKNELPSFLVDNPDMYALLSKGIHELSESECLRHFDVLKVGIELILDEKSENLNKAKRIKEAEKALQKSTSEVL